jgi:putative FmdB family regulatory protein
MFSSPISVLDSHFKSSDMEKKESGMPLFDFLCADCGHLEERLVFNETMTHHCTRCGGGNLKKLMSAPSSLSGTPSEAIPGPGDTACCGDTPGHAGCAGPGSCCGKT